MAEYTPTIGLEIHAELLTKTKMFCNSPNNTEEKRPNVNVCPVCMGHPGTLPVINKEAVRQVLRIGAAVGGELADYTEFDRKNYFYPDIPKGYQISQYKHPLIRGGVLAGVRLTRIHLEEDTAKSLHNSQFPISNFQMKTENSKIENSLIDFNRAGVPLMELVTEPVIHDAETAGRFARELQILLRYLGASEANMEKGEMRVEANISIAPLRNSQFPISNSQSSPNDSMNNENSLKTENSKIENLLGTKVEVKNLNSFKAVEKAIKYELERQQALLEKGELVIQETRGWDENREETFSQRAKEESHDYRYFPDPDLPKLFIKDIPEFDESQLKSSLPELPWERRMRLVSKFGLKDETAEIFVREPEWGRYLDEVADKLGDKKLVTLAANYMASDLTKPIETSEFVEVIKMLGQSELSSRGAKDVLKILSTTGGSARTIAQENNLIQRSDAGEIKLIAEKIISENQNVVQDYKNGKSSSLQFLIGQGMKASKGSANPEILRQTFEALLK